MAPGTGELGQAGLGAARTWAQGGQEGEAHGHAKTPHWCWSPVSRPLRRQDTEGPRPGAPWLPVPGAVLRGTCEVAPVSHSPLTNCRGLR